MPDDAVVPIEVQQKTLEKVSKLTQIQNSKHWKRFVAFCNHNGTKTATEFILALGLVIGMEIALPHTVVVGFALHLLGRFINKHLSPIPYLVRVGIGSVCGYYLLRMVSMALLAKINFDPFLATAAVLSGFLASENAIGAKPILNRPVGFLKRKIKDVFENAGWKFEHKRDLNEFNMEENVEILIEKLEAQDKKIQELSQLIVAKRNLATDDVVEVTIEPVHTSSFTTPQAHRIMGQQTPESVNISPDQLRSAAVLDFDV